MIVWPTHDFLLLILSRLQLKYKQSNEQFSIFQTLFINKYLKSLYLKGLLARSFRNVGKILGAVKQSLRKFSWHLMWVLCLLGAFIPAVFPGFSRSIYYCHNKGPTLAAVYTHTNLLTQFFLKKSTFKRNLRLKIAQKIGNC